MQAVGNFDVAGIANRLVKITLQIILCTSSDQDSYTKEDLERLGSWVKWLRSRIANALLPNNPLDLSATDKSSYPYRDFPDIPVPTDDGKGIQNDDIVDILYRMKATYKELTDSQSATWASGIHPADGKRIENVLLSIDGFITEATEILDLPETSKTLPTTN